MRPLSVAGCLMVLAGCMLAASSAQAVEGVDGVLFHPERVDASVKGCQVSKTGSYDIEAGSAIELSYSYPIVPQAMPDKVSYDVKGEAVRISDLGVRRIEQKSGVVGTTRLMLFFKALKAGEASITLMVDDQKYTYSFKVR